MTARPARIVVLAAAVLALAGCATGPDPGAPRYQTRIPEGSVLVLERALELPPGRARVYLQGGRVAGSASGIDRFEPSCSFGLERVGDEPLVETIEPDRFRTGAARNRDYADSSTTVGIGLARSTVSFAFGIGFRFGVGGMGDGSGSERLEIPLSSPRQPQVDDLTCTVDRPHRRGGRLGLEAIQQAAGDLVRVELAGDDSDDD